MINTTDKPDFRDDLSKSIETLRNGGFVHCNSDCGWLVGCDATNENAVNLLLKNSENFPKSDLVLLVDSTARLQSYTDEMPEIVWDLMDVSEKPMIVVLDNIKNVASTIQSNNRNIGFRISSWPFTNYLCERFRKPILCLHNNDPKNSTITILNENTDFVVKHNRTSKIATILPSIIKIGKGNRIEIVRK
jgi:L-threonylcarbamoyladenylate synthase